ncbi:MAG: SMI1/KNR4 family protein [Actinomycetota bacterium]|nr:SMI1/KNR4 family protein [Actinomycetota bacterium]
MPLPGGTDAIGRRDGDSVLPNDVVLLPGLKSNRGHVPDTSVKWIDRAIVPAPPLTDDLISRVENRLGVRLPEDYLDVVRTHQGGAPDRGTVGLPDGAATSISMLLHFEEEPAGYNLVRIVEASDALYGKLIPFAVDPAGNYFCFDYRGETLHSSSETRWNRPVVLVTVDSPEAEPQPVADGFAALIDSLSADESVENS